MTCLLANVERYSISSIAVEDSTEREMRMTYPERLMTEQEADTFMGYLDRIFAVEETGTTADMEAICKELQ